MRKHIAVFLGKGT